MISGKEYRLDSITNKGQDLLIVIFDANRYGVLCTAHQLDTGRVMPASPNAEHDTRFAIRRSLIIVLKTILLLQFDSANKIGFVDYEALDLNEAAEWIHKQHPDVRHGHPDIFSKTERRNKIWDWTCMCTE